MQKNYIVTRYNNNKEFQDNDIIQGTDSTIGALVDSMNAGDDNESLYFYTELGHIL